MSRNTPSSGSEPPLSTTVRWTLLGVAWGAGLFAAVTVYRALASGAPLLLQLSPIALFTIIGATVGGLVGPMAGAIVTRRRNR